MIIYLYILVDWIVRLLTYLSDVILSDAVNEYRFFSFTATKFKYSDAYVSDESLKTINERFKNRWQNFIEKNLSVDFSNIISILNIYSVFNLPNSNKKIEFYINNNLWGLLNEKSLNISDRDEQLIGPNLSVYLLQEKGKVYRVFMVVEGYEINLVKDFGYKKINKIWLTNRTLVYKIPTSPSISK